MESVIEGDDPVFARKLTEEELKPPSSVGGGKAEDRSSMPLEATVFATGSDDPSNWEHLGTMTGGPVTTGPPLGSGGAGVVQQRKRTSPKRSSSPISAASHRTRDAEWDWLDTRAKIDTDMRLRKLGITNS